MKRRELLTRSTALVLPLGWCQQAQAHHGWSSFDQNRPIYLEGKALKVAWKNPHAELDLEITPSLKLPPDLTQRKLPAQSAPVDSGLLAKTALPKRLDKVWEIELAPLSRMQAWSVAEIKAGEQLAVVGFTFAEEKGQAVLRVEYLFAAGKVYGLRSSPV
ncbi:MAG: DUF6152 family protein [Burkholderiaceae bacterium]